MDPQPFPSGPAMAAIFEAHRNRSRKRLLEFLGTISREDFVRPLPQAANRSLRDALVHSVSSSGFWISALQNRPHERLVAKNFPTIESILPVIDEVDDRIRSVLMGSDEVWFSREALVSVPWEKAPLQLVPAWVMVHVLTHEYHHKGQIVTLARMLGYAPPDTDFF